MTILCQLMLLPTALDVRVAHLLAQPLGKSQLFDYVVQSGIDHGVLGGLWFAAVLFVWFSQIPLHDEVRLREFVRAITSAVMAVLLTLLLNRFVTSIAPIHYFDLTARFPEAIRRMPVTNSFPSQSTALFFATALAVFAFRRWVGFSLLLITFILGALPRMYVGGHFLTDVLAGAGCGIAGYVVALAVDRVLPPIPPQFQRGGRWYWAFSLLTFLWIVEFAAEFRDVIWVQRAIGVFKSGVLPY